MAPRAKPIHVARIGNIRVPVVRNGPDRFAVVWREHEGAPRTRENFKAKKAAIDRADEIARAIANGQADVLTLTGADRDTYRIAVQKLAPYGIPLVVAIDEYVAILDKRQAARICPPAAEIAAALLEELRTDPDKPNRDPRELARVNARLTAVASAFPDLTTLDEDGARRFLRALGKPGQPPLSAKTRDHYLAAAKMLLRYAQRRGWLPAGEPVLRAIKKSFKPGAVDTFSVEEMREILRVCPERWVPFVALGAFAGLRVAEVGRLTWDAVRWDEGEIVLDMSITKTGLPRNIPIEPNLRAWLLPRARRVGRLYDYESEEAFEDAVGELHAVLVEGIEGFHWRDNGLRHSYGSYLYGRERNLPLVRAYMGNSERMVMRYYNSPKTREQGTAWFALAPDAQAIITLPATGTNGDKTRS